ncbi:MAG: Rne/Rng family ribonuclease [Bacteroidales bacterium]|nr:Rne/Rng family ribonuclease [Bacteroidales bacterium]
MDKELVISSSDEGVQIALLEDKRLVELHKEKTAGQFAVGDIFFGKVQKIMQGLNAAFVDIGGDKEGFMHYLDLGPDYNSVDKYLRLAMNGAFAVGEANGKNTSPLENFKIEPILQKVGNLGEVLKVGQPVLVQVTKEPISTKGPKVTGDISIAGRYLVLTPFCNKISVSQKIKQNAERSRLRRLMQSICPQNFGVIVRTVAEGRAVAELDADLRHLLDAWNSMTEKLKHVNAPCKVHAELGTTSALLRDVLTDDFATIYVDNADLYAEVRQFLKSLEPGKEDIVKHYKMETPIFDQFGISRDIRRAFGKIVTIRSGVYLYIEHTEAMHVIDVNSGNHIKAGTGQEDTALQVNIESAMEIARQLRLRDMGGIVIVDFVDMNKAENRKKLFDVMTEEMRRDKARHTILPLSKFGLMQITRQRVRPAMEVDVQEKCPFCDGTGTIKSSLVVIDEIESSLKYLLTSANERRLTLVTHPYVHAYLTKGWLKSIRSQWKRKYHIRLDMQPSEKYSLLDFKFFHPNGDEIQM